MDNTWSLNLVIDGTLTPPSNAFVIPVLKYSGLTLNFNANSDGNSPSIDTGSFSGSYNVEMDITLPPSEGQAGTNGSVQSGSDLSDPQFTFARKLSFDGAPELNIDDGNAGQPDGTLDINGQITLGGIQFFTFAGSASGSGTTTVKAPAHVQLTYGVENPNSSSTATLPDTNTIQGSVKATVTRKVAQIQMSEVSGAGTDVTQQAGVAKGQSYTAGSVEQNVNYRFDNDTLAGMVHANIVLKVLAPDGTDVTSKYTAQRFMRDWKVALQPIPGNATPQSSDGGVAGRSGALSTEGWHSDGTGWYDVPGSAQTEETAFPASRLIEEFLWSALNNSDIITPIYYLVVTDLRPAHWYRIRVFNQYSVTPDQYTSIKSSQAPWKNEDDATVYDSGWVNKDIISAP